MIVLSKLSVLLLGFLVAYLSTMTLIMTYRDKPKLRNRYGVLGFLASAGLIIAAFTHVYLSSPAVVLP